MRAGYWEVRQKRHWEDRAGERATSACKRARQEAASLLYSPSWLRPITGTGRSAQAKRKSREGPSRGTKIARLARE